MKEQFERVSIQQSLFSVLQNLGYDPHDDENFQGTPKRAMSWLVRFAKIDENAFLEATLDPIFPEAHNELVMVKDITFTSLCPHHLIPYHGKAAVGYIPSEGVVGISKLARAVKGIAEQCVMQERTTRVVADGIYEILQCRGVMVVMEATHGCMSYRGIEDETAVTVTSAVRGCFAENDQGCKTEFLRLIGR